ncbi:ATP-binding protein [Microbacterium sp.]|uniref:ATP-binding protein n=1 Tax=Microbacterium sp. TaxID=51671 RepID=UPI003A8890D7
MHEPDVSAFEYRRRIIDDDLDSLMPGLAAVSIEGPKAVGKTATALARAHTVYGLDDPGQRETIRADPIRLARGKSPILIDEWQKWVPSWDIVRRAVDNDPTPGRFLLTGSAAPAGIDTHSGAGRIVPLRMRPLSLVERGFTASVSLADLLAGARPTVEGVTPATLDDYVTEVLAGGFPGMRALNERQLRAALDGYLERVIDRDFAEQGLALRRPDTLRAWMRAYAAATATTASFETIRDAATPGVGNKPSVSTTLPWRDILTRLWILDPVSAWLPSHNMLKQLASSDKHHLADPALAARLLRYTPQKLLAGDRADLQVARQGTALGALFESLVALNLRVYAQVAEADVRHLRTHRGEREVDFIVVGPDDGVVAIEVKLSAAVGDDDVKHLAWLKERIGDQLHDAVIVTTGAEAYRRRDGVAVVPAALLGP